MDLTLNDVSFAYGEEVILSHYSLTLPTGSITCIMGPSGCGKTTLLSLIQKEIEALRPRIRYGMVFQENRLCEEFSALSNVLLVAKPQDRKQLTADICDKLARVGITETEDKKVSSFSGGMKRRVAIVRAMYANNEILLMDEPFKGLDPETKQEVLQYVLDNLHGRTLVVVTHDQEEASMLTAHHENSSVLTPWKTTDV